MREDSGVSLSTLHEMLSAQGPTRTRLYLRRDDGSALLITSDEESKNDILRRLPKRSREVLKARREGERAVWIVTASISYFGQVLRGLGWGQDGAADLPEQTFPHAPQRRDSAD